MRYKLVLLIMLFSLNILTAQILNKFKYATVIPTEFVGGNDDRYIIEFKISEAAEEIGIQFLKFIEKDDWPQEAVDVPCSIAYVSITADVKPNFLNCGILKITITDCNENIITSKSIRSRNSMCNAPYICCYYKWGDAVKKFFKQINYIYQPGTINHKTIFSDVEKIMENEQSLKEYFDGNEIGTLEGVFRSFQSKIEGQYVIGIKKYGDVYKAIVIDSEFSQWKSGEVKAIFRSSSLKDFYSVKWFMNNKKPYETIATMDSPAILSIEFKDQKTGVKKYERYIKVYPKSNETE